MSACQRRRREARASASRLVKYIRLDGGGGQVFPCGDILLQVSQIIDDHHRHLCSIGCDIAVERGRFGRFRRRLLSLEQWHSNDRSPGYRPFSQVSPRRPTAQALLHFSSSFSSGASFMGTGCPRRSSLRFNNLNNGAAATTQSPVDFPALTTTSWIVRRSDKRRSSVG